ncbi:MAG: hypothetical protein COB96_06960 [Planctomycetota bacterium]|nr:MAG: hypothetical protein COB96_06960 [Planctomycetota bacterium]
MISPSPIEPIEISELLEYAQELKGVFDINDYTTKRALLRKWVSRDKLVLCETVGASRMFYWTENTLNSLLNTKPIIQAFTDSPLVGQGSEQINPKATNQGLRDSLDMDTLKGLALGAITVDQVIGAVVNPEPFGMKATTQSRAKTPYIFGRPKECTTVRLQQITNELSEKSGEKYEPKDAKLRRADYTLETIICTIDALVDEEYGDHNEIGQVLKPLFDDPSMIENVIEAMDTRESGPEPDFRSKADEVLRKKAAQIFEDDHDEVDETKPNTPNHDFKKMDVPESHTLAAVDAVTNALSLQSLKTVVEAHNKLVDELTTAKAAQVTTLSMPAVIPDMTGEDGEPSGSHKMVGAKSVFKIRGKGFNIRVPLFDWDTPHKNVPVIDPDYVFDLSALRRILRALVMNKTFYLHGHTGTGKTTLVEQIAARLQWPLVRLNLHGEISQMDLLGREVLRNDNGVTISQYLEGPVPQAMSGPNILLLDEIDYIRANVSYALQRGLEGHGLMLTEDAGRIVSPHPLFRWAATGNTQMKGDEYGMYREARIQSSAFINRWANWVHVDYMGKPQRRRLLKAKVPGIAEDFLEKLVQYTAEHLRAFTSAEIIQPLSPRDYIEAGEAQVSFLAMGLDEAEATKEALITSIIDAAVPQDAQVLRGLVQNVFNVQV